MRSPSVAPIWAMTSPTVEPSKACAAMSVSPWVAIWAVSAPRAFRKSAPLATKSVSQLSSTTAPTLPSTTTPTAPWSAARPARLFAPARPFLRSQSLAASMSPSVSAGAFLQSIIPAPVALRSAATSFALMSAIAGGVSLGLGCSRLLGRLLRLGLGEPLLALGRVGGGRVAGRGLLRFLRRLLLGRERLGRRRVRLGAGARTTLLREVGSLGDGVRDHARHEVGRADRVVVAGDDVLDDVGVAVGVDDRDHRDAEAVGIGHRDVLLLGVDDEHRARELLEVADATEVPIELDDLALDLEALLLDHLLGLATRDLALHLPQLGHAGVDGLEVGEHPAEPAVVHVRHPAAVGLVLDGLPGLLLGADEEHGPAVGHRAAHEPVGGVDPLQRLLEVDDVDAVALAPDEPTHLGVPTARLVTEVDSGLQQLLHGDDSHAKGPSSG